MVFQITFWDLFISKVFSNLTSITLEDRRQILLLKLINLFPLKSSENHSFSDYFWANPANILQKSDVILWLHFGNLRKLLSANVDVP